MGEIDGYLFATSYEGVIWKTHEAIILVGDTEADTIKWHCSTADDGLGERLSALRGKKVKIRFRTWAAQPWSVGNSSDEVWMIEEETD